MEAPKPALDSIPTQKNVMHDYLEENFKKILNKYLDDRTYNENKIKNWIKDILLDAKEFSKKAYPDYDIFIYCFIAQRNVDCNSVSNQILIIETDGGYLTDFKNDSIYCELRYFYFKHYQLDYSLDTFESDIILKANELMVKYLEDRKFNHDKNIGYINNIKNEYLDYIWSINNKLRCMAIIYIFKTPIKGKYYFDYLAYGKDIYKTLFHCYQNDSLLCLNETFFFR